MIRPKDVFSDRQASEAGECRVLACEGLFGFFRRSNSVWRERGEVDFGRFLFGQVGDDLCGTRRCLQTGFEMAGGNDGIVEIGQSS